MANCIALLFLLIGLFFIISMVWKNYKDNQKAKEGFDQNYYRNGADRRLIIGLGVFFLIIALLVKLFN